MKRTGFITLLAVLRFVFSLPCFGIVWIAIDEEILDIAIASGVFGLIQILTAVGLIKLKPFGRHLEIVLSYMGLVIFPAGTIASVLILGYLNRPQIRLLFLGKIESEWTETEKTTWEEFRRKGSLMRAMFVVLLLFGQVILVGAMLIPGLLGSPGHTKRTMADLRSVGTAVEAYAVDNDFYPEAKSLDELASRLEPRYIRQMPRRDAWKHEMRYFCWKENEKSSGCDTYIVASPGKDGIWEEMNPRKYQSSTFRGFDGDFVFKNGEFLRYPAGE